MGSRDCCCAQGMEARLRDQEEVRVLAKGSATWLMCGGIGEGSWQAGGTAHVREEGLGWRGERCLGMVAAARYMEEEIRIGLGFGI